MPRIINTRVLNNIAKTIPTASEKTEFTKLRDDHTFQKNEVKNLQKLNSNLSKKLRLIEKQNTESMLKKNPKVIKIINDKMKSKDIKIKNLEDTLRLKEKELLLYKDLKKIKPMLQTDFNNFIANSVRSLQENLSSDKNSDYDFMIRDVQIEALVSTEKRGNEMAFIIPTSTQLKDIDGNKLQKIKYSLSMAYKNT